METRREENGRCCWTHSLVFLILNLGFLWLTPLGAGLACFQNSSRNCHCLEERAEPHPWPEAVGLRAESGKSLAWEASLLILQQ